MTYKGGSAERCHAVEQSLGINTTSTSKYKYVPAYLHEIV